MPRVQFGGVSNNRLSGVVSGLDSDGIINKAINTKLAPVKKMQDEIKFSNEQITAFYNLKTYMSSLQGVADGLRGVTGSSSSATQLANKKVLLSSDTISNPSGYLDITADSSVDTQELNIRVNSIAKPLIKKTTYFSDTTSSVTDIAGINNNGRFTAGTFQINSVNISLIAGDSLATVASKINALSTQTNVSASIIQPNSGQYRILLKSLQTGVTNAFTISDPNTVLNDVLTQSDTTVQAASNAQITIDDSITVTRATNTISDYLKGLTITVYNPTADNVKAEVDYDRDAAQKNIRDFVDVYNEFINFAKQQQERDGDKKYLDTAKIRKNAFLDNALSILEANLSKAFSIKYGKDSNGKDSSKNFGVYFPFIKSSPGSLKTLTVDTQDLSNALKNNYGEFRKALELQYTSTSQNFILRKSSNKLGANTSFSMTINVNMSQSQRAQITYGGQTINATFTPNDVNDLTKGGFIEGPVGTPFEGFKFQYTGTGNNETTDMTVSQGAMDLVYNTIDLMLQKKFTDSQGNKVDQIDSDIAEVNNKIKSKKDLIDELEQSAEKKKRSLIDKHAIKEAEIAKLNTVLSVLDAQENAMGNRR